MKEQTLQSWTTVSLNSGVTSFTQDDDEWLLIDTGDCTFWLEVSSVALPGGAATFPYITLQLQSAPLPDEALFTACCAPIQLGATPPTAPLPIKTVAAVSTSPLARYVRWVLSVPNATTNWSVRFRITAVPTRRTFLTPVAVGNCALWLRADLGVTLSSTGTVTAWADQSPTGDSNQNLTGFGTGASPSYTPIDSSYARWPTINLASASMQYLVSGAFANPLAQPCTWLVVGHNTSGGMGTEYAIDHAGGVAGMSATYVPSPVATVGIGDNAQNITAGLSWSSPGLLMGEYNGASSALYFNNITQAAQATGTVGAANQPGLTVGATSALANFWDGSIAEIIAFNSILTANQKAFLKSYIVGRYGFVSIT